MCLLLNGLRGNPTNTSSHFCEVARVSDLTTCTSLDLVGIYFEILGRFTSHDSVLCPFQTSFPSKSILFGLPNNRSPVGHLCHT